VYRATDTHSDEVVALKQLLDTRHASRFAVEARLLSLLRHPRVVRVLDFFEDPAGHFLVMSMEDGKDLGVVLREQGRPGLPLQDVIDHVRHAAEALQYVHEQQIVHRDVKPQNLICGDRGVVVVDFGIARALTGDDAGTVGIGTPRYMAPEIFAGGRVSARSDVFSLAATMWALLAGTPPMYGEPTRLTDLRPDVPPETEEAIVSALSMIPEERPHSAAAFAELAGAAVERVTGASLVHAVDRPDEATRLLSALVRTAAGVFGAAASSVALVDSSSSELVFQAAWGIGAEEIVGVRLPLGIGLAGSVAESGSPEAVPNCARDPRFQAQLARGTGYVPSTMLVVPLRRGDTVLGVLSVMDRRDGERYEAGDVPPAELFADLAVTGLDVVPPPRLSKTRTGGLTYTHSGGTAT
jgi:hypothetical protein